LAGLTVFAYLLGAVPFGLILVKWLKSVDLRQTGSGNIGATNAGRTGGWPLGLLTLVLDVSKGALPVYLSALAFPESAGTARFLAVALTAVGAFSGHLFPIYLKFKTGGKGVATAAGCFFVISPVSLIISSVVFIIVTALSKRVSVGSMAAAASLPLAVLWIEQVWITVGCATVIALLIIIRHRDNIRRLRAGTEPTIR